METIRRIVITNFCGDADGVDLIGCSFVETAPHSHQFNFFGPDTTPIQTTPSQVSKGPTGFSFPYMGFQWSITDFLISEKVELANGSWSAVPIPPPHAEPTGDDPETGTFQAQGGTGGDDYKLGARASASA